MGTQWYKTRLSGIEQKDLLHEQKKQIETMQAELKKWQNRMDERASSIEKELEPMGKALTGLETTIKTAQESQKTELEKHKEELLSLMAQQASIEWVKQYLQEALEKSNNNPRSGETMAEIKERMGGLIREKENIHAQLTELSKTILQLSKEVTDLQEMSKNHELRLLHLARQKSDLRIKTEEQRGQMEVALKDVQVKAQRLDIENLQRIHQEIKEKWLTLKQNRDCKWSDNTEQAAEVLNKQIQDWIQKQEKRLNAIAYQQKELKDLRRSLLLAMQPNTVQKLQARKQTLQQELTSLKDEKASQMDFLLPFSALGPQRDQFIEPVLKPLNGRFNDELKALNSTHAEKLQRLDENVETLSQELDDRLKELKSMMAILHTQQGWAGEVQDIQIGHPQIKQETRQNLEALQSELLSELKQLLEQQQVQQVHQQEYQQKIVDLQIKIVQQVDVSLVESLRKELQSLKDQLETITCPTNTQPVSDKLKVLEVAYEKQIQELEKSGKEDKEATQKLKQQAEHFAQWQHALDEQKATQTKMQQVVKERLQKELEDVQVSIDRLLPTPIPDPGPIPSPVPIIALDFNDERRQLEKERLGLQRLKNGWLKLKAQYQKTKLPINTDAEVFSAETKISSKMIQSPTVLYGRQALRDYVITELTKNPSVEVIQVCVEERKSVEIKPAITPIDRQDIACLLPLGRLAIVRSAFMPKDEKFKEMNLDLQKINERQQKESQAAHAQWSSAMTQGGVKGQAAISAFTKANTLALALKPDEAEKLKPWSNLRYQPSIQIQMFDVSQEEIKIGKIVTIDFEQISPLEQYNYFRTGIRPMFALFPDGRLVIGVYKTNLRPGNQAPTRFLFKVFDLIKGECVSTFDASPQIPYALGTFKDNYLLLSNSSKQDIELWDIETKQCVSLLKGHEHYITHFATLADDRIVSHDYVGKTKIWKMTPKGQWACQMTIPLSDLQPRTALISMRGLSSHLLAAGFDDGTIRLWHVPSTGSEWQYKATLEGGDIIQAQHYDQSQFILRSSGQLISCFSGTKSNAVIKLWDIESLTCLMTSNVGYNGSQNVLLEDGRLLTSQFYFSFDTQQVTLDLHFRSVLSAAGAKIISQEDEHILTTATPCRKALEQCAALLKELSIESKITSDSSLTVLSHSDKDYLILKKLFAPTVRIPSVALAEWKITEPFPHIRALRQFIISELPAHPMTGTLKVTVGDLKVDMNKMKPEAAFFQLSTCLIPLPNNRLIIYSIKNIKIWDLSGPIPVIMTTITTPKLSNVSLTTALPNGQLATVSDDVIHLWNIENGSLVTTLKYEHESNAQRQPITSLTLLPDGRLVSSDSYNHSFIRVWNTANATCTAIFKSSKQVRAMTAFPDGRLVSTDGTTITLWNLNSGECTEINMYQPAGAGSISKLTVLPNGGLVGVRTSAVHLLDISTGLSTEFCTAKNATVFVLPSGFVAIIDGQFCYLYDLTQRPVTSLQWYPGSNQYFSSFAMLSDDRIAVSLNNGMIQLFRLPIPQYQLTIDLGFLCVLSTPGILEISILNGVTLITSQPCQEALRQCETAIKALYPGATLQFTITNQYLQINGLTLLQRGEFLSFIKALFKLASPTEKNGIESKAVSSDFLSPYVFDLKLLATTKEEKEQQRVAPLQLVGVREALSELREELVKVCEQKDLSMAQGIVHSWSAFCNFLPTREIGRKLLLGCIRRSQTWNPEMEREIRETITKITQMIDEATRLRLVQIVESKPSITPEIKDQIPATTTQILEKEKQPESKGFLPMIPTQVLLSLPVAPEVKSVDENKLVQHVVNNSFSTPQEPELSETTESEIKAIDRQIALIDQRLRIINEKELWEAIQKYDDEMTQMAIAQSLLEEKSPSAIALAANAKLFGYGCQDVSGGGNCFYHGVSDQLRREAGVLISHERLRELAVNHVLDNIGLYSSYNEGSMHTFIDKMSQSGEWADGIHVLALSRVLNVDLVIIGSNNINPNIIRRSVSIATLYLGHQAEIHYQSLFSMADAVANQALQDKIKVAPVDSGFESNLTVAELRALGEPIFSEIAESQVTTALIPPEEKEPTEKYDQKETEDFKQQLLTLLTQKKGNRYSFSIQRPTANQLVIHIKTNKIMESKDAIRNKLVDLVTLLEKSLISLNIKDDQYEREPDLGKDKWTLTLTSEQSETLDKIAKLFQYVGIGYLPSAAQTQSALFYQPRQSKNMRESTVMDEEKECIAHCALQ